MVDIVTGGAGFIGSHLVERLLANGRKVRVVDIASPAKIRHLIDHPNLEFFQCDMVDGFCELNEPVEIIYHLAALADIVPSIENPEKYFKTNVTGTLKVLEIARKIGIRRFVYAASSSCYGHNPHTPTSENDWISPQYPYALTKFLGEEIIQHWGQVYEIPYVSLRLFNVYGPRSRTTGAYGAVFGVFMAQILAGKPLTVVGDGKQSRDFVYVTDVVDAMIAASTGELVNAVYNVGSGSPESINYIVKLLGGKDVVYVPKRPGEPEVTWADITKIKDHLVWKPKVSIEDGVRYMLKNINYWSGAPVWTPEAISEATRAWFLHLGKCGHA